MDGLFWRISLLLQIHTMKIKNRPRNYITLRLVVLLKQ